MEVFNDYAYYYNLLYANKDYAKEAEDIHKLIQTYKDGAKNILDLGCGTGGHDNELIKYGYEVRGVDMSETMIEEANKKKINSKVTYEVGDIRQYKTVERFDVVSALFHVISYQNKNIDLRNTFKTAYNALNKKGIFIFDAWYGPGVLRDLPTSRIKEVEDSKNKIIRIAEPVMHPNTNCVDVNYKVFIVDKVSSHTKKIEEVHKMRYLFTPEVELLLELEGFEMIAAFDSKTLQEATYDSWYSIFIGMKN